MSENTARMRWFRSYGALLDSPDWLINLLSATACVFIPIIGPIVMVGWLTEVVLAFHRDPEGGYPKFDWGRFGDYLGRGVIPFVVQLLAGILMTFIMLAGMAAVGGVAATVAAASPNDPTPFLVVFAVAMALFIGFSFLLQLLMIPMILGAALTGEIGRGFDFGFIRSFVGKTWLQMLIMTFFISISSMVMFALGSLVLCVGAYAAMAWVSFAYWHLKGQLYEVYLARGGEPLPLREDGAAASS